jgi:short-subunit dehydrogenase involved in D-alanine esterification of teichoic acids
MQVSNNTVLLTGGTSGIGFELLRQLYQLNNRMIVTSSNEKHLANIKKQFTDITTVVCDLSDNSSVRQLIDKCWKDHRDINVLINNAGIQYNYSWTEEKDGYNKISTEICVNFTSPMQIVYGLLGMLTTKQNSAIVNVSSGLALAPKKSAPIYCATKSAIHSVTKALRYQLENTTVKVFEIIPPPVDTAMSKEHERGKIAPKQVVDEFLKNFRNNNFESNIGKIKLFRIIQRISPKLADNMKKND